MTHFLSPLLHSRERCGIRIERTGEWLVDDLQLAGDSTTRRQGLMGRDELPTGHALAIAPSQGVHTFGMRFPLDIVAVSRDGHVVKYRCDVAPRRIVFAWSAFAILELAAGSCRRARLVRGDQLLVAARSLADPA